MRRLLTQIGHRRTIRFSLGRLCIVLNILLSSLSAFGGTLTAELDRTEGAVGEVFTLTVSAEGDRDGDLEVPKVPGLAIERQAVSQSMTYANGHLVRQMQLSYAVTAEKAGEFTIPSLQMQLDGKKAATLPLFIKVRDPAGGKGAGGGSASPGKTGSKPSAEETGGIFVKRTCDKESLFVGEQSICTVQIFHRGNINGGQRVGASTPDFRRFNVEGEKRYQKIINGQRYGVIELREVVVPTKAGSLELPAFAIDARVLVMRRRGNPFDQFLGGHMLNFDMGFAEETAVTLKSEPQHFQVKPLPDQGKPAGFSGLVGKVELTSKASPTRVRAGETVTITISVTGNMPLDALADPQNATWRNIGRIYPDKPSGSEQVSGEDGIHATKVFKFALVPSHDGTFSLGTVSVPTFDPISGLYSENLAKIDDIMVDPGKAEERTAQLPPATASTDQENKDPKKPESNTAKDLIPPHASKHLRQQTITKKQFLLLNTFTVIPPIILLLSFSLTQLPNRQRHKKSSDYREFSQQLDAALLEIKANQISQGLATARFSLQKLLAERAGRPAESLATGDLIHALGARSEAAKVAAHSLFASLDAWTYGNSVPTSQDAISAIDRLRTLVEDQERQA